MQNALLRACAMSHAWWAAAPAAPPSIAQSGRCAHATPTTGRERERERRRTAYCAQSSGALNAFAALVSRFSLSLSSCIFAFPFNCCFLCCFSLPLSAAFASLCCARFTFPLTTCCNCATVQFQARFDATLVSLWLPVSPWGPSAVKQNVCKTLISFDKWPGHKS